MAFADSSLYTSLRVPQNFSTKQTGIRTTYINTTIDQCSHIYESSPNNLFKPKAIKIAIILLPNASNRKDRLFFTFEKHTCYNMKEKHRVLRQSGPAKVSNRDNMMIYLVDVLHAVCCKAFTSSTTNPVPPRNKNNGCKILCTKQR